jgi:hypothetical protein
MAKQELKQGDKVTCETPQGKTRGKVVKKLTSDTTVANEGQKGTEVKASKDDPRYLVESDKTGKRAVHKPGALTKV